MSDTTIRLQGGGLLQEADEGTITRYNYVKDVKVHHADKISIPKMVCTSNGGYIPWKYSGDPVEMWNNKSVELPDGTIRDIYIEVIATSVDDYGQQQYATVMTYSDTGGHITITPGTPGEFTYTFGFTVTTVSYDTSTGKFTAIVAPVFYRDGTKYKDSNNSFKIAIDSIDNSVWEWDEVELAQETTTKPIIRSDLM